jgi:hypothetical protein
MMLPCGAGQPISAFGTRAMTDRKSTKPFLPPLLIVATTNAFDECSTVC